MGLYLLAGAIALLAVANPAGAIVTKIRGHGYGITLIRGVNAADVPGAYQNLHAEPLLARPGARRYDEPPFGGTPLTWHAGPVMHSNAVHIIYWDPNKEFTPKTKEIVGAFFTGVAHDSGLASNVFAVAGQYADKSGNAVYASTFASTSVDEAAYPPSGCAAPKGVDEGPPYTECLTNEQLQTQLSTYISANSLAKGPAQQYFLMLPHAVVSCLPEEEVKGKKVHPCSNNFFCAYHSYISPGTENEVIYSDIPFSLMDNSFAKGCQSDGKIAKQLPNGDLGKSDSETRFADIAIKYVSHEWVEALTDPLVNYETAWVDGEGLEIGDKCNGVPQGALEEGEPGFDKHAFTPTLGGSAEAGTLFNQSINERHFYLQSEWDNGAKACTMKPVPLTGAGFTAPAATAGTPVTFSGTASDAYAGLSFTWSFGDATEDAGATLSHTYGAPGSYTAKMTAKDSLTGATAAPVEHTIVVAPDELPTASFAISPNPATAGSAVEVNGGASGDPDGSIVGYAWSFGDGAAGSGGTASHAYASAGSYAVTLTVTDSAGQKGAVSQVVSPITPPPNSNFSSLGATVNQKTGAITFRETVANAGTLGWLLTFPNGKFGVFAAKAPKCKAGFIKLNGKCRPAKIVFAKGTGTASSPGTLSFTVKPTASALKALKNALRRKKGLPVTATLTFQSSLGGSPVSHTQTLTVRLKK